MTITRARLEEIIHAAGLEPCDYEEVYSSIKTGEIVSMARLALTVLTTAPLSFEEEQQYAAYFMRSRGRPDLLARHSMPYRETYEERIAHRERCDGTLTNEGIMPIDMLSAALRNAPLAPSDNRGWNACRAAMLNHSESERDMVQRVSQSYKLPSQSSDAVNEAAWKLHDTLTEHGPLNGHQFNNLKGCFYEALKVAMCNSPVIPDGWIKCSERMPETHTPVWCFGSIPAVSGKEFGFEGWLTTGGFVAENNSSSHGGCEKAIVTHWMPLPAAPQQEVK